MANDLREKGHDESKAIAMAVGIVRDWAAGRVPNGKGHVHPDVRAAAGKAMAEWEKVKSQAHAETDGKVKATVALAETVEGGPFPGSDLLPVKPVPPDSTSKAMFTAHRIDSFMHNLMHATERFKAASAAKDPGMRSYHTEHLRNHLSRVLAAGHMLAGNLRRNYPAEGRELDALSQTIGLARSLDSASKAATFAHLLQTVMYNAAHAKRHAEAMSKTQPDALWKFNADHSGKHLRHALEHAQKLAEHVRDNYPAERRFLTNLPTGSPPYAVRLSAAPAAGPSRTKAEAHYRDSDSDTKRCGTCSMFRDGSCTLVQGSIDPGYVCDYWEKAKTVELASPGTITAPGAKPQYGLYQRPAQTVSPSPPLPPEVKLPTAAEIRKLISQVPECTEASLSQSARNHLDAAAAKLGKDDPIAALHVLRIAQSDIYAAHKADLGMAMPAVYTANVFTRVPSAEQASANTEMIRSKDREMKWRALEQQVATAIDRIRRQHFHGHVNNLVQEARFTGQADSQGMSASALEKVLRLAGSPSAPDEADPAAELLLAAQLAVKELAVFLASDDGDGDDDSSGDGDNDGDDDGDGGHAGHATYKALLKKKVPPARAAAMCAKADKKVKASALAESAQVILAGLFDEGSGLVMLAAPPGESAAERRKSASKGHALSDGSYPIEDEKHLHSAAVLAASGHGDVAAAKRLIRKRARELGVDVNSLPGFGGSSDKDEKVAASMVALAAGSMHATPAQGHPPFHGVHSHAHVHSGDNMHGPGPDRMGHGGY